MECFKLIWIFGLSQNLMGRVPFMTKGPFALFFGGESILPLLSEGKAGQGLKYLYMVSFIFNVSILGLAEYFFSSFYLYSLIIAQLFFSFQEVLQ